MPYKVNYEVTKPNLSVPNFYQWVSSLPDNFMESLTGSEGPFPGKAGKTPKQIIDDFIARTNTYESDNGISRSVSNSGDGLTRNVAIIYPTKEIADSGEALGSITTAEKYLRDLYSSENNIVTTITKTEI